MAVFTGISKLVLILGTLSGHVFVEVFKLAEQKVDAKTIREQLNMIYVKHALLTAKKMIEEGDSISDIPEFESLSLRKEGK